MKKGLFEVFLHLPLLFISERSGLKNGFIIINFLNNFRKREELVKLRVLKPVRFMPVDYSS